MVVAQACAQEESPHEQKLPSGQVSAEEKSTPMGSRSKAQKASVHQARSMLPLAAILALQTPSKWSPSHAGKEARHTNSDSCPAHGVRKRIRSIHPTAATERAP